MKPLFFLDLDTQKDFLYRDGARYLAGGDRILPVLSKLTEFARERSFPVISTICSHDQDPDGFHGLAAHCRRGKDGAAKVPETLLLSHHVLENQLLDRNMAMFLEKYDQLVLEKEDFGLFANPNAARLLMALGKNVFVYGCLEESLSRSIAGLAQRKLHAVVVEDACAFAQPAVGRKLLADLETQGIRKITSRQLFATLSD